MSILKFIQDKKYLVLFYIILMSFISSVSILDKYRGISIGNILYINGVCGIFFIIYLLAEYLGKRKYYSRLNEIITENNEDIINRLPEAENNEQRLFNNLIVSVFNEQNNRIEHLYNEKRENFEFVTTWVHEIKTPISVIRLLAEGDVIGDEVISSIEEEIDKIEGQVEQALYYSRIDDFSKDYFINEIELDKVIKETIKRNAKLFISKKISITVEDSDMEVLSDKKWLLFILNQILGNSLKYTNNGGNIKIYCVENEREKIITIEDNGIGISIEDLGRVFDKGFTGKTGRQFSKSTGMGLYLSRKLARKLGHDIRIESMESKYTRARIFFPKLDNYLDVTKM